ncbi:MAG: hypothetical protein MUP90_05250 [Gammaproteobacteria bacterium]|nr:hypothetical protein [Gammaproteobacteria bacterium]
MCSLPTCRYGSYGHCAHNYRLLATRIAIPVFGTVAVVVALKFKVVYDLILDSNSVILVCITVPFIAAMWWKQANRSGALACLGTLPLFRRIQ